MPGIPLAIMLPGSQFTLLDSIGKKIRACNHFIEVLKLENVTAVHMRAEEFSLTHAKQFDCIVSRATAFLPTILGWSLPFLAKGAKIVLYKSPSHEELVAGEEFCKHNNLALTKKFVYLLE